MKTEAYNDPVITFVYLLLRDELSAGVVEEIITQVEEKPGVITFSNGFIADYASDIVNRLSEIHIGKYGGKI